MNPEEQNKKLIEENNNITASLNASKEILENQKKEEVKATENLNKINNQVADKTSQLDGIKSEIQKTEESIKILYNEKSDLINETDSIRNKAIISFGETVEKFHTEIKSLEVQIEAKKSELNTITGEVGKHTNNIKVMVSEKDNLTAEIFAKQNDFNVITNQFNETTEKLDGAVGQLSIVNGNLEKAQAEIKDSEVILDSYQLKKEAILNEISHFQETVITLSNELVDLRKELSSLEEQRIAKDAEYQASAGKIFELVRREETVTERENYAIERFKVAGLEY